MRMERELERIMAAYQDLPTDQLISDTIFLTRESDEDNDRWAAAAVLGYSQGGLYLDTARTLLRQIFEDAKEISWRMEAYEVVRAEVEAGSAHPDISIQEIAVAANHGQGAMYLHQVGEVLWHYYVISLQHAWHFLANSARIIDPGFTATPTEEAWLELIRSFRNHMEHRDKAVRDISSEDWRSMSRASKNAFELGYRRDAGNNIAFVPIGGPNKGQELQMPINQAGFEQAARFCQGIHLRVQKACLRRLFEQFAAHRDTIPPLDQVGGTMTEILEPTE